MGTPSHRLSRVLHLVTQWKSVVTSMRGSASISGQVKVTGFSTSPPALKSQVAGSNRGGAPTWSTGHLMLADWPGGSRPSLRIRVSRSWRGSSPVRYFERMAWSRGQVPPASAVSQCAALQRDRAAMSAARSRLRHRPEPRRRDEPLLDPLVQPRTPHPQVVHELLRRRDVQPTLGIVHLAAAVVEGAADLRPVLVHAA